MFSKTSNPFGIIKNFHNQFVTFNSWVQLHKNIATGTHLKNLDGCPVLNLR